MEYLYRAFISGVFRLIVTVQYFQTQDATYAISRMALWCGAEMVLVLLVFCAPAFPNVFREMEHLPSLFASWGKYFRLSSSVAEIGRPVQITCYQILTTYVYERVNEDVFSPHNPTFQRTGVSDLPTRYHTPHNDQLHVSLELGILRTI